MTSKSFGFDFTGFLLSRKLLILAIVVGQFFHLIAGYATYYLVFVVRIAYESGILSAPLFRSMGFFPTLIIESALEIAVAVAGYIIMNFALRKFPQLRVVGSLILLTMYISIVVLNLHDALGDLSLMKFA